MENATITAITLTPNLDDITQLREAIRVLEIGGSALELPYVPAQWHSRDTFRYWFQRLRKYAQHEAKEINVRQAAGGEAGPERVSLQFEVWREPRQRPRADGATGGYRIRRVPEWRPGRTR